MQILQCATASHINQEVSSCMYVFVCVSVIVQRTREEASVVIAAAPGPETSETDGGTTTEEHCCCEGAGDDAGEMYRLMGFMRPCR